MCTSFRFNYFVEEPKMETNKRLNAKQKKIYQHRTIAPLAANQQQEKYENIKKKKKWEKKIGKKSRKNMFGNCVSNRKAAAEPMKKNANL